LLNVFLLHTKTFPEIYVSNLLKPLFKDNNYILKNQNIVQKIVEDVIEIVNKRLKTDP